VRLLAVDLAERTLMTSDRMGWDDERGEAVWICAGTSLTRVVACAQSKLVCREGAVGNLQDGLQRGLVSNCVFSSSIGGV
jgi:hypothetical protein